jgi:hypothetical protein
MASTTLRALQAEARTRRLRVAGTKADLAARLARHDAGTLLPTDHARTRRSVGSDEDDDEGDSEAEHGRDARRGSPPFASAAAAPHPPQTKSAAAAATAAVAALATAVDAMAALKDMQAAERDRLSLWRSPGLCLLYFARFCASHATDAAAYVAERVLNVAAIGAAVVFLGWLYQLETNREVRPTLTHAPCALRLHARCLCVHVCCI